MLKGKRQPPYNTRTGLVPPSTKSQLQPPNAGTRDKGVSVMNEIVLLSSLLLLSLSSSLPLSPLPPLSLFSLSPSSLPLLPSLSSLLHRPVLTVQ